MTKLLEALLETIPADPIPVRKVIIGVHWTLVSSKYCGLGSTLVGEGPHGHSQIRDVGVIHQKSAPLEMTFLKKHPRNSFHRPV